MARRSNRLPNFLLLLALLLLPLGTAFMIWAMMESPPIGTFAAKTESLAEEAAPPPSVADSPPIFAPELDLKPATEWLRASGEAAKWMLERGMRSLPIFSARDGVKLSTTTKRDEPEELPPPLPALIEREETIGPVDELPRPLLNNVQPGYPEAALAAGLTGKVILKANIDADGAVKHLSLASSSNRADLDAAAFAAVRTWKFTPARRGGLAVPCDILVPVEFRIRK